MVLSCSSAVSRQSHSSSTSQLVTPTHPSRFPLSPFLLLLLCSVVCVTDITFRCISQFSLIQSSQLGSLSPFIHVCTYVCECNSQESGLLHRCSLDSVRTLFHQFVGTLPIIGRKFVLFDGEVDLVLLYQWKIEHKYQLSGGWACFYWFFVMR